MSRMKDYMMFLEEKGYVEWNDSTGTYDHCVDDIYAQNIMAEYTRSTEKPNA